MAVPQSDMGRRGGTASCMAEGAKLTFGFLFQNPRDRLGEGAESRVDQGKCQRAWSIL